MKSTTKAQRTYAEEANALTVEPPQIAPPDWNPEDFFKQRSRHRSYIIWLAICLSSASFLLLVAIIIAQVCLKIKGMDFQVISDRSFQVLAVSILGEAIGIIFLISRSVWSNHEFNLMKKKGG